MTKYAGFGSNIYWSSEANGNHYHVDLNNGAVAPYYSDSSSLYVVCRQGI